MGPGVSLRLAIVPEILNPQYISAIPDAAHDRITFMTARLLGVVRDGVHIQLDVDSIHG